MRGAVGVDVGGTYVKAVRRGEDGHVEERTRRPTPASPDGLIDLVGDLAESVGAGLTVGVGLAGLVDQPRGVLVWGPHLPGEDLEVGDRLSQRLGVPVVVDNDANLAALAEQRQGAARGRKAAVMLTLGTGIGMGLIVDGRIFRGRGHAGEVGHVTVEAGGEECACGRRGCWETKVSGRRLEADAVAVLGPGREAGDLVEAARARNEAAVASLSEAASWLAVGVEALVLALDPDIVVVGGAAAQGGDTLLEPIRRRLAGTEGAKRRHLTPVVAGILGPDAGAIGAAICAAEETPR